jgi:hypothetical protein
LSPPKRKEEGEDDPENVELDEELKKQGSALIDKPADSAPVDD